MVCGEGLRVWRSVRNWQNQIGNRSTSAASVSTSPRTEGGAAGVGAVGHTSNSGTEKTDNDDYLCETYWWTGVLRDMLSVESSP
jgi:hypothetical protein